MTTPKRTRSSNFNRNEELLLLDEIIKFKNIVECKQTNKMTTIEKENAWQNILLGFNSKNFQSRTLEQIKAKYDNLKTKARKEAKLKLNQSEIDVSRLVDVDSILEAVVNIINLKPQLELVNPFDSDAQRINDSSNETNDSVKAEHRPLTCNLVTQNVPIISKSIVSEMEHNDNAVENEVKEEAASLDFEEEQCVVSPNIIEPISIEENSTITETLRTSQNSCRNKNLPRRLRQRSNIRVRTHFLNESDESKETYFKRKLEIMQKRFEYDCIDRQIRMENEQQDRKKRCKREEEEHTKRMILLDLDIKLKQKELEKCNYN